MTPKIFKTIFLLLIISGLSFQSFSQKNTASLFSPNKQLEVICNLKSNSYSVKFKGETVLKSSQLGLIREDGDFTKNLRTVKVSAPALVTDNYMMVNAKKSKISYKANESIWETINSEGKKMNIVFRISNDGVAFRYIFPEKSTDIKKISSENKEKLALLRQEKEEVRRQALRALRGLLPEGASLGSRSAKSIRCIT